MSRSNQTELKNPAVKFYDWSSENKCLKYFDKELTDEKNPKGTNILVKLPFRFLVLDILSTITGYSDFDQTGIYSNEVKDLNTQSLNVRTFKKTDIAEGLYKDIKDKCVANGGSYTSSVYIAFKEGETLKIGHIKFKGAALGQWIEFGKKNSFYSGGISITGSVEGKKGATRYNMPVFEKTEVSSESDEAAKELDKELQEYLNKYFARNHQENIDKMVEREIDVDPETEHKPGKIEPNKKVTYENASSIAPGDPLNDLPFRFDTRYFQNNI